MHELKIVPAPNSSVENSLRILQSCKDKAYEKMETIMLARMEYPTEPMIDDVENANYMSILAIDCMMELARSGLDLISSVNDKIGATEMLVSL